MMELRRHATVGRARRNVTRSRQRSLPHLYAARKRRPIPDLFIADRAEARRGGKFRWFFSTCLAAAVGGIAIAAVVLGSMDASDGRRQMLPTLRRGSDIVLRPASPSPVVPRDGLAWTLPKVDRQQVSMDAASVRYVILDPVRQVRGNREYTHKKPYARIKLRLAAIAPEPGRKIPVFNAQNLYAPSVGPDAGARGVEVAEAAGTAVVRVVELLGSVLPPEDNQELSGDDLREIIKRTVETSSEQLAMRPTFVPEGAALTLPAAGPSAPSRRPLAEPISPRTSVLEKSPLEVEDPAGTDGEQVQATSLYTSLFHGALDHGVPPEIIQTILRVHAYEADFRRRAGPTDAAEMFFDLREDNKDAKGADGAPGELLYTALMVAGQPLRFFRFRTPDGAIDYYNEQGSNSRKFLMRQPVRSDDVRLTSGFGLRFHPLLNARKMHGGVDWSAPVGTPIMAAGNGVIEEAHFKGQYGNYVKIRHANGYETGYAHMSRIANGIMDGVKVRQGQIIGYLGSTGLSTGPHLHFEVSIAGRLVDPVKIPMPEGRKLTGRLLADFQRERMRIEELMRREPVRVVQVEAK